MSRFEAYNSTKDKAIQKIESGCKQSRFIRPLPPSISKDKKFCEDLHEIYVKSTIKAIKENFETVEESTKLEQKLNQLNSVISDEANCTSEQEAWRPSDIAVDNQAAHDQPTVLGAKNKLQQEILTPLQDEVAELEQRVSMLSNEIAENAKKINQNVGFQQ